MSNEMKRYASEDYVQEAIAELDVQPDWNQNDETAADFVKNRTHYTETVEENIEGIEYNVPISKYSQSTGGILIEHNLNLPLQLGQIWKCISMRNGTIEATSVELEVKQADDGLFYLGDLDPVGAPNHGFRINANTSIAEGGYVGNGCFFSVDIIGVSGTFTETRIKHIDPKYIKDMYYEETVETDISGEEFAIGSINRDTLQAAHGINLPFEIGQEWRIEYTATSDIYTSVVKEAEDGTLYIGDLNLNTSPIYVTETEYVVTSNFYNIVGSGNIIIVCVSGVKTGTTIHKLPAKYLPCFDFDVSVTSAGVYELTDLEQVQMAYDNNMTIKIVYTYTSSGVTGSFCDVLPCIRDCMVISEASGNVFGSMCGAVSGMPGLEVMFDADAYANGEIVITSATLTIRSYNTLVKVYAAPF